jgi:hypothetical protein
VESADPHREAVSDLHDDIAFRVVEVAVEISASKGGEIVHSINEKLRVADAEFLV